MSPKNLHKCVWLLPQCVNLCDVQNSRFNCFCSLDVISWLNTWVVLKSSLLLFNMLYVSSHVSNCSRCIILEMLPSLSFTLFTTRHLTKLFSHHHNTSPGNEIWENVQGTYQNNWTILFTVDQSQVGSCTVEEACPTRATEFILKDCSTRTLTPVQYMLRPSTPGLHSLIQTPPREVLFHTDAFVETISVAYKRLMVPRTYFSKT